MRCAICINCFIVNNGQPFFVSHKNKSITRTRVFLIPNVWFYCMAWLLTSSGCICTAFVFTYFTQYFAHMLTCQCQT